MTDIQWYDSDGKPVERKPLTYYEQWEVDAASVQAVARGVLESHFGRRCEEYEPGCPCCERWALLERLLANPYEDTTEQSNNRGEGRRG